MTGPEDLTYERAAWRIVRVMAVLGGVGAAVALAGWGWRAGAGFLLGSLLSGVHFLWLRRLVDALGGGRKRGRSLWMAVRFLVLPGAAYVIFRFIPVNLAAVFAGMFVLTAAVFVEGIFEIVYARK